MNHFEKEFDFKQSLEIIQWEKEKHSGKNIETFQIQMYVILKYRVECPEMVYPESNVIFLCINYVLGCLLLYIKIYVYAYKYISTKSIYSLL